VIVNTYILSNEIPESVSQGERRTQDETGGRMGKKPTTSRRSSEETIRDAQEDSRTLSRTELQKRINMDFEDYAKQNNLWTPLNNLDLGTPFPSGNENEVYYNQTDGYVYKVNNLFNAKTIPALLEQVKTHNQLFPETRLDFVGLTGFDGRSIYPIYKQRLIDSDIAATPQDIDDYMKALGFEKTGNGKYSNGEYVVSDLFPRNVLKDANGDLYVIDNIIKPVKAKLTVNEVIPLRLPK
jgi:hypothetical protein